MSIETTKPEWTQNKDEPAGAFGAFTIYLSFAPKERSLTRTTVIYNCEDWTGLGRRKRASKTIERWSTLYSWVDRARAYDAHIAAKVLETKTAERIAAIDNYKYLLGETSKGTLGNVVLINAIVSKTLAWLAENSDNLTVKELCAIGRLGSDSTLKTMGILESIHPDEFGPKSVVEIDWLSDLQDKLPSSVKPDDFIAQMTGILSRGVDDSTKL